MCGAELAYVVRGTTYSRATSVEIRGVYDGGLFYAHTRESGGCGFAWHRWPEGYGLRSRAEPYLREWNERNCQQQEGNE
jgi:hypothetical protein